MANAELARDSVQIDEEAAAENRLLMEENGVVMVNLIGEPEAGKTTILQKILPLLGSRLNIAVIGGDSYPIHNNGLLGTFGLEEVRSNTSGALSLDASSVNNALRRLPLSNLDLVVVENVGNLPCPAKVDLGGDMKIVVASVTDGMDTPSRYPDAFRNASAALINKIDLLPYQEFSLGLYIEKLIGINESLKVFPISALKGEGIEELSSSLGRMIWKKRRNLPT